MDITETLYVTTRQDWRDWLAENYDTKPEIWLISYLKRTGRANLPYNTAVEEALCFGWIDSIRKSLDEERSVQRFSPRKSRSSFSQTNKERLARMIEAGKVIPSVMETLGDVRPETFKFPAEILAALRANDAAWAFFASTSPSYQRIRAAYVETARDRGEEFQKRLNNLVEKSAAGKQFGYGIEDYY
jgi:uncharacterized protein YdeI (YjbR/CyaY-like superfamily)